MSQKNAEQLKSTRLKSIDFSSAKYIDATVEYEDNAPSTIVVKASFIMKDGHNYVFHIYVSGVGLEEILDNPGQLDTKLALFGIVDARLVVDGNRTPHEPIDEETAVHVITSIIKWRRLRAEKVLQGMQGESGEEVRVNSDGDDDPERAQEDSGCGVEYDEDDEVPLDPETVKRLEARATKFRRLVHWSDEDGCLVGSLPDICGDCCCGTSVAEVFQRLDEIAFGYARDEMEGVGKEFWETFNKSETNENGATIQMFTTASKAQERINAVFDAMKRIVVDGDCYDPDSNGETVKLLRNLLDTAEWLKGELDAVGTALRCGERACDDGETGKTEN